MLCGLGRPRGGRNSVFAGSRNSCQTTANWTTPRDLPIKRPGRDEKGSSDVARDSSVRVGGKQSGSAASCDTPRLKSWPLATCELASCNYASVSTGCTYAFVRGGTTS